VRISEYLQFQSSVTKK